MQPVKFTYKNHRGEIALRTIVPDSLEYLSEGNPDFGYPPGWFLSGHDLDKNARRSFYLDNIIFDEVNRVLLSGMKAAAYKIRLES